MLSRLLGGLSGRSARREGERLRRLSEKVCGMEWILAGLGDAAFHDRAMSARERLCTMFRLDMRSSLDGWVGEGVSERQEVIEGLAVAKEAARRALGIRLHDEQLMGAMALREGKLPEMKTGEGKTLVVMLAAALDAMAGVRCHVVTVNDYLARRDATDLSGVYSMMGLSTGLLFEGQGGDGKRAAYSSDVVYGVNHEFGFDYLRDRTAMSAGGRMQGDLGLVSAIVDEVDSILIDEARTPLILSGHGDEDTSVFVSLSGMCRGLPRGMVEVDEKSRQAHLSEDGFAWFEERLRESGILSRGGELYEDGGAHVARALQATLNAHFAMRRDVDYIIGSSGEVFIVDDKTGRVMEGRRWSDGLHQAVEAKEGVEVRRESRTMASITYQNFFRLYGKLSGLTGTAMTQAAEFMSVYGLRCVEIPTNRPVARIDLEDVVYRTEQEKFEAIVEEVAAARQRSQPVLIGTASVEDSERLSGMMSAAGIGHEVLNAKQHEREAMIIEAAGRPGAVTVATNMAGRGTDVELGGSRKAILRAAEAGGWGEEELGVRLAEWERDNSLVRGVGGLYVIGASRNDSRRVDLQLRGRSGRQGDPGRSRFFVSLEDTLFRVYGDNPFLKRLAKGDGWPRGVPMEHPLMTKALARAQSKVEGMHSEARGRLLEFDETVDSQRKAFYGWREDILVTDDVRGWAGILAMEAVSMSLRRSVGGDVLPDGWGWLDAARVCGEVTGGFWMPEKFGSSLVDGWGDTGVASEAIGGMAREAFIGGFGDGDCESLREIMLSAMDAAWQNHLAGISEMMQGIHLRAYAQADPKREFKREAFDRFRAMREWVAVDITSAAGWMARKRMDGGGGDGGERGQALEKSGANG